LIYNTYFQIKPPRVKRWVKQNRAALWAIPIPILTIAIATPALAQSTVVMTLPGANG
jgi:hypothetical protein